jgi:hypothetical protein
VTPARVGSRFPKRISFLNVGEGERRVGEAVATGETASAQSDFV